MSADHKEQEEQAYMTNEHTPLCTGQTATTVRTTCHPNTPRPGSHYLAD